MKVGRTEAIEVRLADTTVAEAVLRKRLRGRGRPEIDQLTMTPIMRVTLRSEDPTAFSIQSVCQNEKNEQPVLPGEVTYWEFSVTPLRGGKHVLCLDVSMTFTRKGRTETKYLPSYEKKISVAVAPARAVGQFLGKNWQWATGTVALPAVAWIAKDTSAGRAVLRQVQAWLGAG
jgi:hypothetical protein